MRIWELTTPTVPHLENENVEELVGADDKRLTLRKLNRLKKLRALKQLENAKHSEMIEQIYGIDANEEPLDRIKRDRAEIALTRDRLSLQRAQLEIAEKIHTLDTASTEAVHRLAVPKARLDVRKR